MPSGALIMTIQNIWTRMSSSWRLAPDFYASFATDMMFWYFLVYLRPVCLTLGNLEPMFKYLALVEHVECLGPLNMSFM